MKKSPYEQKIVELHQQIKDLAVELQHTRETLEQEKKNRDDVIKSINKLKDDIKSLQVLKLEIETDTNAWRKVRNKEKKEFEAKLELAKTKIKDLKLKESNLKQKLSRLSDVETKIITAERKLLSVEETITDLLSQKTSLQTAVTNLINDKKALDIEIEKSKGRADKLIQSAEEMVIDAQIYYEALGAYISAIAQWHAVHGTEMPELLHSWQPKQIVVSSKIHKLLKNKQI